MCVLIIDVTVVSCQACVKIFQATGLFILSNLNLFFLSNYSSSVFCLLSSPFLSSLLSLFFPSWGVYHYVYSGAMLYSVQRTPDYRRRERERKKNTEQIEGEVGETAFVCHCTHLVMSYFACTRVSVCICLFSTVVHVFIFVLMFRLHVLYVSLSSCNKLPNPHRPWGFALLVSASLCSHFVWNLHSLIIPAHFLSIAQSLPLSPSLSLPLWSVRPLQHYSARRLGH